MCSSTNITTGVSLRNHGATRRGVLRFAISCHAFAVCDDAGGDNAVYDVPDHANNYRALFRASSSNPVFCCSVITARCITSGPSHTAKSSTTTQSVTSGCSAIHPMIS